MIDTRYVDQRGDPNHPVFCGLPMGEPCRTHCRNPLGNKKLKSGDTDEELLRQIATAEESRIDIQPHSLERKDRKSQERALS